MRITLIGLGLIGGSIASAAKNHYADRVEIVGYDTDENQSAAALAAGAIDHIAESEQEAVAEADLVIVATPISTLATVFRLITGKIPDDAIVTDVASVKSPVQELARNILGPQVRFVGGHPMAGSEFSGFEAADPYLFENAAWALCSDETPSTFEKHHSLLIEFVQSLGARILVLPADEHDKLAARTSHLPQLLAVNLMNVATSNSSDSFGDLAAGGFRDMTRIASSSYGIWSDILAANHSNILDALAEFAAAIQTTRNRIIREDYEDIEAMFAEAAEGRENIPASGKGFLYPLADLYVGLIDEPGALRKLTSTLFEADINIKDLELLKLREGTGGTFRVSFDTQDQADKAKDLLTDIGYSVRDM